MTTERDIHDIISAAVRYHAAAFEKRHVAAKVLDGDVSMFLTDMDYLEYRAPQEPMLAIGRIARLRQLSARKAFALLRVHLKPGTEDDGTLTDAAWMAFASAIFTGASYRKTLGPVTFSTVAWGASVVVHDENHWLGRQVNLQLVASSADYRTTVEFYHMSPRDAYAHYVGIAKRATEAATLGVDAPTEKWSRQGIELALMSVTHPTQASPFAPLRPSRPSQSPSTSDDYQYTYEQFATKFHGVCCNPSTSAYLAQSPYIEVACVRVTHLDGTVESFVVPCKHPTYAPDDKDKKLARLSFNHIPLAAYPFLTTRPPQPTTASPSSPSQFNSDWPTLLYRGKGAEWVVTMQDQTPSSLTELQDSHGLAYYLLPPALEIAEEEANFRAKRLAAGGLVNALPKTGTFKKSGPFVEVGSMNFTPQQPLTVDWNTYNATITRAERRMAIAQQNMDPQLGALSRATTAEVMAKGDAAQSTVEAYSSDWAPMLGDWMLAAYNTLLSTDYKEHQPGYKGYVVFWDTLHKLLDHVYPTLTPAKFKSTIRHNLEAFDIDVQFEDSSVDVLRQRSALASSDRERARLNAQIRLVLGEDPAAVVRALTPTTRTDQISEAAVENFAIKGGQTIPVSPSQNHFNHFLTHFADAKSITEKATQGTDPVDLYTSLTQLGHHMADHRDEAANNPFQSSHVPDMDAALKIVASMADQVHPAAVAAIQAAQDQAASPTANTADTELAAKLQRQQASWEQRAKQRETANATAMAHKQETHRLNLQIKTDEAALKMQLPR